MRRIARIGAVALAAALLAGCNVEETARRVGFGLLQRRREVARAYFSGFDYESECDIGASMAGELCGMRPFVRDARALRYVNLVGNTVAGYSVRPGIPYFFGIVEDPVPNAFSCPGGYILVSTGALRNMKDEAELAGLLAHEVAHAANRDLLKLIKSEHRKRLIWDVVSNDALEKDPGLVGDLVAGGLSHLMEKGFDKGTERRADEEGVLSAMQAGYDPKGLARFLERVEAKGLLNEKGWRYLRSHPRAAERLKVMGKAAASEPPPPGGSRRLAGRFGREMAGVLK